jgi:DNA processing protein
MSLFPPTLDTEAERQALVALSLVPGVGPGRLSALVDALGSAEAVQRARPDRLAAVPGVGPETARQIAAFRDEGMVEAQFRRAERVGARFVTRWDADFPALLRETDGAPAFLWVRGDLGAPDALAVALVGTRQATPYGERIARAFGQELAARGVTVVSGLAYGIDAAAHEGALDAPEGRTLAVLGSGVDRIYPARHGRLAGRILESGALVSELPLGAAPDAPNFPRRNRIVSGLCRALVVIEAFETGGALITARFALDQNREVFAVPSPLGSAAGRGTNNLIARGEARLVQSVDEVLAELGVAPRAPAPAPRPVPPDLPPLAARLYEVLTLDPCPLDALLAQTNLDAPTALVHLLDLEFRGLVRQFAGKQFARA